MSVDPATVEWQPPPIRSSAFALASGYILLGLAALFVFALPFWYAWTLTIEEGRAEILRSDAMHLRELYKREGPSGLAYFIDHRVGMVQGPPPGPDVGPMPQEGERLVLFTDAYLKPLAGNLPAWPKTIPMKSGSYSIRLRSGGPTIHAAFVYESLPGGYNLLVGRDLSRFLPLEHRFWSALAGAIVFLGLFGTLGAILLRRALMRRVRSVQKTAQAIVQGDLSKRLSTRGGEDELATLATTFNAMLDQIEQSVNGIRNVSNAVAHDLRTPLTELRSRLEELSCLSYRDNPGVAAQIEAAVGDVDRVIAIFNAILRLNEIDSGLRRAGFVHVNLSALAAASVEFYQPLAESKNITLTLLEKNPVTMEGDPLLLSQALGNLIDNALKYVPAQGRITLEVDTDGSKILLTVADSGPGIQDSEKEKVIQRFYRGDSSRGTPGAGLGLSLVDAIAKLHGGALTLSDNSPGLRARLTLTGLVASYAVGIVQKARAVAARKKSASAT